MLRWVLFSFTIFAKREFKMTKPKLNFEHGVWVSVNSESPKENSVTFTLTEQGVLGLAYFTDNEFVSLMPTYMGEPNRWLKNPNGGAEIIDETAPLELV